MSVMSRRCFSEVESSSSYSPVLPQMADMLARECMLNSRCVEDASPSVFNNDRLQKISIKDFLVRMCKYGKCSPGIFVCTAIYVDKFVRRSGILLRSANIHQVVLTAFTIAAKLNDDQYYSNDYYASIGTFSMSYMNTLEQEFLTLVDWDVYVKPDMFKAYYAHLSAPAPVQSRQTPTELRRKREKSLSVSVSESTASTDESIGDSMCTSRGSSLDSTASGSAALALRARRVATKKVASPNNAKDKGVEVM